jgi:hypothetical protein
VHPGQPERQLDPQLAQRVDEPEGADFPVDVSHQPLLGTLLPLGEDRARLGAADESLRDVSLVDLIEKAGGVPRSRSIVRSGAARGAGMTTADGPERPEEWAPRWGRLLLIVGFG